MTRKPRAHRKANRHSIALDYADRLRNLMDKQLALIKRLQKLLEEMEDEEDSRLIAEAKKRNAGKPGIPWAEAKKRLGLD